MPAAPTPPQGQHPPTTHAAAGGDSDLDGVPAGLADMLQVERLVGGLVVATLNGERRGVDAHLHRGWPVGVHLPVLMVVALELQLQVRPGRTGRTVGRGVGRDVLTREPLHQVPPHHRAPCSTEPHHIPTCPTPLHAVLQYNTVPSHAMYHPHTAPPHRGAQHHAMP